ncbi:MAG TPA: hypothetical protein VK081_12670, partial [Planctomycetota bacterium]|nr:hypothetical protein [Planctomycetota bacterium]
MRSASAAPSAPAPAPADLGPAEPARTGATRAWLCAAGAALCLSVAAPGAVRGAEALVVVGLALLYRVVTGGRGSALRAYLVGVAYLAAVSWSLRHIVFAAYVAIALLGGVYFAILPRWVRGLGALRVPGPLAFGLAVAGAAWLRAYMPEITYPHAQPAHALFRWPALLYGPVALGGEELANVLLAACAAAAAAGAW